MFPGFLETPTRVIRLEPPKTIRLRWRIGHDARTPITGITDPYKPEVKEQLLTAHADVVGSVLRATQGRV